MERVYLLLRNNQQTGPFTIGELLQQQLRPSDMIWIEGKSTAWTYLSELELIPFAKTNSSEAALQGKPSDEIERKAEELRQKVLYSAPKTFYPRPAVEVETYTSPYKLPEDEIEFVDHRKEKRLRRNTVFAEFLLTCLVIGLFMVGIFKGKSFLSAGKQVHNSVATEIQSHDQHTAEKNKTVKPVPPLIADTVQQHDSLLAIQKPKNRPAAIKKTIPDSASLNLTMPVENPVVTQARSKEETVVQPAVQASQQNVVKKQDTPSKKDDVTLKKEAVPPVSEVNDNTGREEKRGFLRGLFKKKKKEESQDKKADKED